MSAFSKSLQSTLIFITHNNLSSIANTATSLYTLFSPIVGDGLQSCPEPFLPSSQLQWQTHTCTGRTCFVCEKRFSTTSTALPDVSTLGVLCQIKYLCIIYLVFIWWYFWTNKKKKNPFIWFTSILQTQYMKLVGEKHPSQRRGTV